MFSVKDWKSFCLNNCYGTLIFFIPILLLSLIFSSGFVYLGVDTTTIFITLTKIYPYVVSISLLKILGVILIICSVLHFLSLSFKIRYKLIFGFIFFFALIIRLISIYPALADKWYIIHNFLIMRNFVQYISMLPIDNKLRYLLNNSAFIIVVSVSILNLINYMKALKRQARLVRKSQNSIYIDELDSASKIFAIYGLSLVISIITSIVCIPFLQSSFIIKLPYNNTQQNKTNVFIFAIDSLRYDRLSDPKYTNVMPYIHSQLKNSVLSHSMLVGIPRTFPSWVEIATGSYALKNGVRNMFPDKETRQDKPNTIFSVAKENGYSTLFISDFAGDIFPRYPFGATIVDAPTLNLNSLLENGILSALSPIQAVLLLPRLHRLLPALLESPEIADPRLVGQALANNLVQFAQLEQPVFLTSFFSSAHFPYAAPGPWYGKFQSKDNFIFQKIPDQALSKHRFNELNNADPKVKQQTIALYNGGLNAIDYTIKNLMHELKEKGWLNNAVVLIFGDHGENLYDGNIGMGHGDGVSGEYSNVTPLIIWAFGAAKQRWITADKLNNYILRSVDIAPTLAHILKLNFENTDGSDLLSRKINSNFSCNKAYMETGIWFNSSTFTPENHQRIKYPDILQLLDIDKAMNFEFYIKANYRQMLAGVKERAWVDDKFKLIVRTTKEGLKLSLYLRTDTTAKYDLSKEKKYSAIVSKMWKELNAYVRSQGVEIVKSGDNSSFYAEHIGL